MTARETRTLYKPLAVRLVIFKDTRSNQACCNYTCEELFNQGYRLVLPEVENPAEIFEVTLEDIAKLKGCDVSQIKIKK